MSRLQIWVLVAILLFPVLLVWVRSPVSAPEPQLHLGEIELLRQEDQARLAVVVELTDFAPRAEGEYLWHYKLELMEQDQLLVQLEGIKALEWEAQQSSVLFLALDHHLLESALVAGGLEYQLHLELVDSQERVRAQAERRARLALPHPLRDLEQQVSWRWVGLHQVHLDLALNLANPNAFDVQLERWSVEWKGGQDDWLPLELAEPQASWLLAGEAQDNLMLTLVLPSEYLGLGIIEQLHRLRAMPYQLRWRAGLQTEASLLDLWGIEGEVRGVLEPANP